jgi:hypothetical protein
MILKKNLFNFKFFFKIIGKWANSAVYNREKICPKTSPQFFGLVFGLENSRQIPPDY